MRDIKRHVYTMYNSSKTSHGLSPLLTPHKSACNCSIPWIRRHFGSTICSNKPAHILFARSLGARRRTITRRDRQQVFQLILVPFFHVLQHTLGGLVQLLLVLTVLSSGERQCPLDFRPCHFHLRCCRRCRCRCRVGCRCCRPRCLLRSFRSVFFLRFFISASCTLLAMFGNQFSIASNFLSLGSSFERYTPDGGTMSRLGSLSCNFSQVTVYARKRFAVRSASDATSRHLGLHSSFCSQAAAQSPTDRGLRRCLSCVNSLGNR